MYLEASGRRQRRQISWLVVGSLIAATGCSLTPGNSGLGTADKLLPIVPVLRHTAEETEGLAKELAKTTHEPYAVEQGDVLLIQPTDLESNVRLPPDQPVLADGSIDLGEYGRIVVIGMTLPEIEALAQKTVEQATKETTKVHVRLIERVSKVFYVLGEVNAPGYYTATGRETVLDAILIAGGLTDQASRKNIIVSRPTPPHDCRVVLPVCYNHIVQIGDTTTNYQIFPGDRVFIPAKSMWERCRKKNPDPCECLPQCKAVLDGPNGCRDVADKKLETVQIAEKITSKK